MTIYFSDPMPEAFTVETNFYEWKWSWTASTGLRTHLKLNFYGMSEADVNKIKDRMTSKMADNTPAGRNLAVSGGVDGITSLMHLYEMSVEPFDGSTYVMSLDLIDHYEVEV